MMNNIYLPVILKSHRCRLEITQEEMARLAYISRPAYASYEEGRAEPSLGVLIRIAKVAGYSSLDDFLSLKDADISDRKAHILYERYNRMRPEQRKIVDFIMNL